jgi:hypothetical protein
MRLHSGPVLRSPLDAALVALAADPDDEQPDLAALIDAAPDDLADRVVEQGLAGLAHRNARRLNARFPALVDALDTARKDAWSNHLTKVADLAVVAVAFELLGDEWAVVKGPVLAQRTYGRGDLRNYGDLDVIVNPAAFADALDLLAGAGAVLLDRNWRLIAASMRAELSLEINGRTTIDLHWHLLNEAPLRQAAHWDMTSLLARTVPADVGGVRVPVLDDVDALAHIASHACLSGGNRMIWLKDVERQQRAFPVPSPILEERSRDAGIWAAVHLGMRRAAATFGSPPPPKSPAWSTLSAIGGCDVFQADGRARTSGETLARATRSTLPRSMAAVGTIVAREQLMPLARRHGWARWLPPPPPTLDDLHRDEGTEADRDSYLRRITA